MHEAYTPYKSSAIAGSVNALVGDIALGNILETVANRQAVSIGRQFGTGSAELAHAVDAAIHADSVTNLTNVFTIGQHPQLTAIETALPALVILGEYADPQRHAPTEKNTSWFKRFALNTHLVLATGATSFAPAVLAEMLTRVSEHREVIMSTPEAAILLYAAVSLARSGKRIYEYAAYPLRVRKANIRKHIAESRAKWEETIAPDPVQVEHALRTAKLKVLDATMKTTIRPVLKGVSEIVAADVEKGRLEKIRRLFSTNPRILLSRQSPSTAPKSADPSDIPPFLEPGAAQVRSRLDKQKR